MATSTTQSKFCPECLQKKMKDTYPPTDECICHLRGCKVIDQLVLELKRLYKAAQDDPRDVCTSFCYQLAYVDVKNNAKGFASRHHCSAENCTHTMAEYERWVTWCGIRG